MYYNTVAEILRLAAAGASEREMQRLVSERAFSESVLTIIPALKSGKWQLLTPELKPILRHSPTMPLTLLEKRWLKAIADDPRIKLFNVKFPDLEGIEPLFTREDYKIYDRYLDGDPFEDFGYISRFNLLREAVRGKKPVKITMTNRFGNEIWIKFIPVGFEYSEKDDKIRVISTGSRFTQVNLARITSCSYYHGKDISRGEIQPPESREVTLEITDERKALERVMLHFSHFEKQAEKIGENRYLLRIKYYLSDETEMVIRILSFGQFVRVTQPQEMIDLIKQRLISQKGCGLK